MELEETLMQWKQKTHLMRIFGAAREKEKPCDMKFVVILFSYLSKLRLATSFLPSSNL